MKNLRYLFSALVLFALGCSSGKSDVEEPVPGPEEPATGTLSLKVMSFNIRYSNTTDQGTIAWSQRRKPCIDMIKDVNPGVIGMQESRTEQRSYLKAMLTNYELLEVPGTGTGTGGNSTVLYRKDLFTCVDWGYFYLSDTPEKPSAPWNATNSARRSSVWVHLKDNASKQEFVFLSTHFPESNTSEADNEARLKCAQLNVERMKSVAGNLPVFIVGDMNCSYAADDTRRSALAPYYAWMQSGREKAPERDSEFSYNNFGNGTPTAKWNLDHIFYKTARPVRFQTITSHDYGVAYLSDHYPITLTVEIP